MSFKSNKVIPQVLFSGGWSTLQRSVRNCAKTVIKHENRIPRGGLPEKEREVMRCVSTERAQLVWLKGVGGGGEEPAISGCSNHIFQNKMTVSNNHPLTLTMSHTVFPPSVCGSDCHTLSTMTPLSSSPELLREQTNIEVLVLFTPFTDLHAVFYPLNGVNLVSRVLQLIFHNSCTLSGAWNRAQHWHLLVCWEGKTVIPCECTVQLWWCNKKKKKGPS